MSSVTFKFLDDNLEIRKDKKEKQRLKNLENQKKYRLNNLERIKAYNKKKNDLNKIERAKGDRKKWVELGQKENLVQQINLRTFKNLANNNEAQIYNDSNGWWYEIKFYDGRDFYKSGYFKTKLRAMKDLKLAM